jgi:hypothetical protein
MATLRRWQAQRLVVVNAPEWLHALHEPELRAVVLTHARLRRRVRDAYLLKAAATLDGSTWRQARALRDALRRYETSTTYRRARRLGREDGDVLDRLLFQALSWGPCPTTVRRLHVALTRTRVEKSLDACDTEG